MLTFMKKESNTTINEAQAKEDIYLKVQHQQYQDRF